MVAQIGYAILVVYSALLADFVLVTGAVLGHIYLRIVVAIAQTDQRLGEAAGVDRPTHRGKRRALRHRAEPSAEQGLRRIGHPHRGVVVQSDIVGLLMHRREIASGDQWREILRY